MKPHDGPPMTADLDACDACGEPATSWARGPGGVAVGCCSDACRALIAKAVEVQDEYGPAPDSIEPASMVACPFCTRPLPRIDGRLVQHNDPALAFVPHPSMPGVMVANRCGGSGCEPRMAN